MYKKIFAFVFALSAASLAGVYGQTQVSGMDVIKSVYPEAEGVEKINEVWFGINDCDGSLIGYTLSSKPFTQDIKGYMGATPVIIVMDKDKTIVKVAMLSHSESPGYVALLDRQGFFNTWNSLKISDARKKKASADSYSGATFTAKSVSQNIEVITEKAIKNPL